MMATLERLRGVILPAWFKWVAIAALCAVAYGVGRLQEARRGAEAMSDYMSAQAARKVAIDRAQSKVIVETEIKYRDRIQKIYLKGDVIEKQVPVYVTASDNAECRINAGFVRSYNAAWSGEPSGPPASSDHDPAGVSLSEVGETDAFNAAACLAWRELAVGLKEHYQRQQGLLK
ncbi:hypothetical protein SAMN05518865_110155 [Duganella sp. CF458]|uniref:hypothetical protein n=1 Tax=Duganella sp. CF458 TaxID=1884368 RepID=UPI0008DFCE5F|nr:hypothetical protein [Duganella sp. CF458]SFG29178.1 hypothetical protein SAMN05518865_110155 [Duganella sp. CF458]